MTYPVGGGVKQGSLLSPVLLLVLDPFLRELQASGVGLSINNFYAGGFHHAEDARTLGTSKESLEVWRTHIAFLNIPFCNCRHIYTLMYLGSDHVNLCIVTNTSTTDCDFMFTPGLFLDMFLYF